jgi:pimeloyl-ACP methyl ester carboxylesterase
MDMIPLGNLSALEAKPVGPVRATVLMVHGWWGGAWVWDRFMARFSERGYRCVAVNLRGHPDSLRVPDVGSISFAEHLDDLRASVAALGGPYLLTHSYGGLLSLKLGEDVVLPAVANLVPVAPKGFFSARTSKFFAPYLPDMLRARPILPDKAKMFDADLNCLPPAEREEVYARMVPASGRQGIETSRLEVDPARLKGPRLIISGTRDRLIPAVVHRKMAVRFGAEYHEYPNRAHYIMREPGWEQVADDIIDWFDRAKPMIAAE